MNVGNDFARRVSDRIALVGQVAPDSIGDLMHFELAAYSEETHTFTLTCDTHSWMRNIAGTLHGGMCATIVDQAMGFISYCVKPGEGTAPTVQMQVTYHRPILPGNRVSVLVRVLTVTKSLMHLTAEAYDLQQPDKLCLSSSATYFYKPLEH